MQIKKIEIFPLKIRKEHVYLGDSAGLNSRYDYYLRPEYRCPYSKNMETFFLRLTADTGLEGWGEALAPVLPGVAGKIVGELFAPVLLGEGIPLFTQGEPLRRFRLEEVRRYGQFAELVYGRK